MKTPKKIKDVKEYKWKFLFICSCLALVGILLNDSVSEKFDEAWLWKESPTEVRVIQNGQTMYRITCEYND